MGKKRLDLILVEQDLAPTRQKAQGLIIAGQVTVNGKRVDKAGAPVNDDALIEITGKSSQFVSRGGDKINPAFDYFPLNIQGAVCLDLGASTGGFTDCMLKRGATLVYAVDVGHNQLDFRLREDLRVRVMEKTHAKDLPGIVFDPRPSFATVDVSFIGIRKVLPYLLEVLTPRRVLALVKPQFELGPEYVSTGGVVKEKKYQDLAVQLVCDFASQLGLKCRGVFPSPLRGEKKGNQEYFVLIENE
ncbi:MAG: TlyA family RNA methyltransferase [Deltaproteobacteria bacterium]|nr:TlyA family RNA methyltransferase [Deltaproteobacteria bacterium]